MQRPQHGLAVFGLDIRLTTTAMRLTGRIAVITACVMLAMATMNLAHAHSFGRKTRGESTSPSNNVALMVWTATLADHPTLLLVPTIHRLLFDDPRIDTSLKTLVDSVQAIVLEAPLNPPPAQMAGMLRRYGVYPTSDNITNHVNEITPERLARCARQSGQGVLNFFQLKPWLAALAVIYRAKTSDTNAPEAGVPQMLNYEGIDQRLAAIAATKNMPLIYLETAEQGIKVYSDMPSTAQEAMLIGSCEDLAGVQMPGSIDLGALEDAWVSGKAERLERLIITRDPKESDAYYTADQYIFRANTDLFAAALARYDYFHGKGPILIAVGAGHFFGSGSLLERLRSVGYTISPPRGVTTTHGMAIPVVNNSLL
ncbi:TraB/GumN family protein [Paraburkholderia sp. C35]|uniref:TraB/GumN family protein n=1 Tax=Paraburkholderia sp. C35 TaxID=2126993 RepID=UPI000D698E3E|nr:TraB/GumN family protein [Paraburkholderia sp. C35]